MKKKQKISFTGNLTGEKYIKVDDVEIMIDIANLDNNGRKEIINGLGNILLTVACYSPKNE